MIGSWSMVPRDLASSLKTLTGNIRHPTSRDREVASSSHFGRGGHACRAELNGGG